MDGIISNRSNHRSSNVGGDLVPPSRGSHNDSSRQGSDFTAMMSSKPDPRQALHGLVQPFYTNLELMDFRAMN